MSVITLDEVSQHVIKQITWNPNLVDGTYDCACLSNDDEDEVKRRGQWWVKQGSGGGVRGEWVAPETGAE